MCMWGYNKKHPNFITFCHDYSNSNRVITARGLYVADFHGGCPNDLIYLIIVQNQINTVCPYESHPESELPKLLFSPANSASLPQNCEFRSCVFHWMNNIIRGVC